MLIKNNPKNWIDTNHYKRYTISFQLIYGSRLFWKTFREKKTIRDFVCIQYAWNFSDGSYEHWSIEQNIFRDSLEFFLANVVAIDETKKKHMYSAKINFWLLDSQKYHNSFFQLKANSIFYKRKRFLCSTHCCSSSAVNLNDQQFFSVAQPLNTISFTMRWQHPSELSKSNHFHVTIIVIQW